MAVLIVATLRRVALAQTLPRGERGPRLATDLQPRPVPQSYPAGSGIGSGGVRVFQNKILGSASELVLGVKTRRCHGAFFAPGLSLWIFKRDTLFCLYTEVSYPGYAPWPLHGRAAMCEKHSGEYRENKAGKYREPLHVVSLAGAGQELPQASAPALHIQLLHRLRTENLDAGGERDRCNFE